MPLAASRKAWRVLPADEVIFLYCCALLVFVFVLLPELSVLQVVWRPFANEVVPVSAARAHFLSGRRVLLPGVYHHMWYLGERVSLQHNSGNRLVPKDPPESMLASDEELARLYAEARGDAV